MYVSSCGRSGIVTISTHNAWQAILHTWRTRCSHVLEIAVKQVVDPSHGPIRSSREIASAIRKAIPARNRKAIAAQFFVQKVVLRRTSGAYWDTLCTVALIC